MSGGLRSFRLQDFNVRSQIGQGAYGQIYQAVEFDSGTVYALKALNRKLLVKMKKQSLPVIEKTALVKCAGPFTVRLFGTFKDDSFLYFVFELAPHGDLAEAVRDVGKINHDAVKLISAQILSAICTCHQHNVIHRDLKPENVLLDERNHARLTDFGTAMICEDGATSDLRRSSIVGTPEFGAPELLNDGKICFASDIWALGCTICDLLIGKAPFYGENIAELMENITKGRYCDELKSLPKNARSLIESLIQQDPKKRLGYGEHATGYQSIKKHPFFHGVDWNKLEETEMPPFATIITETAAPEQKSLATDLLDDDETIVMEGLADRKRHLSWKERELVLTSKKRMLLFNRKKKTSKGEIKLSRDSKVVVNNKEWVLKNGKTEYQFKSKDGQAGLWAATILRETMKP